MPEAKETLALVVRRGDPELVGPVRPTPQEAKRLSDIDDQDTLRTHVSLAFFYRARAPGGADPASVIRRALGEALVHYYPLAGRLREVEGRKLVVQCTGEGVLFVEAEAEARLVELEAAGLTPPFPCMDQLLYDVEGSSGMLHTPLLLIQVTRMLCGSFVLALRLNHTMCDAIGIAQFINAVAELARGLPAPTVAPAWCRDLLEVRNAHTRAPRAPFRLSAPASSAGADMVMRSFTFGPSEVAAIRKRLPPSVRATATTFDVLAAFVSRARTTALEVPLGEQVMLTLMVNIRGMEELGLPAGYYGNAGVASTVVAEAAALRYGSLAEAVALVQQAKAAVTSDYVHSTLEELVLSGRVSLVPPNMFFLSDIRRVGFHRVDFGWGEPVFAGTPYTPFAGTFVIGSKNRDGEETVTVPVMLPRMAMERFEAEMASLLLSKL